MEMHVQAIVEALWMQGPALPDHETRDTVFLGFGRVVTGQCARPRSANTSFATGLSAVRLATKSRR
jgi:hypothetical protein